MMYGRLDRILSFKEERVRYAVRDLLRPKYRQVVVMFQTLSALSSGARACGDVPAVALPSLIGYLNDVDELFNGKFTASDAEEAFHSASTQSEAMLKHDFLKAKSPGNLVRYQFLELIIRLACVRFAQQAEGEVEAVTQFINSFVVPDANDVISGHEEFFQSLFTEENDVVMKENLEMLRVVYDVFRQQNGWPGLQGSLSHASFVRFLDDLKCYDENCTKVTSPLCWPVGKVIAMDEYDGHEHLVMNFNEFMLAVAFIVYMRDDFDEKLFSESLDYFFSTSLHHSTARLLPWRQKLTR